MYLGTKLMSCFKTFREIQSWTSNLICFAWLLNFGALDRGNDETVNEENMKNKRLEIVTCRLAGGGWGEGGHGPECPPLDPGLHVYLVETL